MDYKKLSRITDNSESYPWVDDTHVYAADKDAAEQLGAAKYKQTVIAEQTDRPANKRGELLFEITVGVADSYRESIDDLVEDFMEGVALSSWTKYTARPEYIALVLSNFGDEQETYDSIIKAFQDASVKEVKFWRADPSDDWEWTYNKVEDSAKVADSEPKSFDDLLANFVKTLLESNPEHTECAKKWLIEHGYNVDDLNIHRTVESESVKDASDFPLTAVGQTVDEIEYWLHNNWDGGDFIIKSDKIDEDSLCDILEYLEELDDNAGEYYKYTPSFFDDGSILVKAEELSDYIWNSANS